MKTQIKLKLSFGIILLFASAIGSYASVEQGLPVTRWTASLCTKIVAGGEVYSVACAIPSKDGECERIFECQP